MTTIASTGNAHRKKRRRKRGRPQQLSTPVNRDEQTDTNGNFLEHSGAKNIYLDGKFEPTKNE